MMNIPFFNKKKEVSDGYIFFLFLAGERIYGMAMDEHDPEVKSVLYSESVDPFLKNAALKLDKVLSSCEQDLGKNIFLKKTVLFLNSLYVTESGAIREDYLKIIKKLLNDMELSNSGYVNFYDVVSHEYGKLHAHYFMLEESLYDYVLYEFEHEKLIKTSKVAKTQNLKIDTAELANSCPPEALVFSFFINPLQNSIFAHEKNIGDRELRGLFAKIYIHNTKKAISKTEPIKATTQQLAPGFVTEDLKQSQPEVTPPIISEDQTETLFDNEDLMTKEQAVTTPSKFPKKIRIKYLLMALAVLLIIIFSSYMIFLHSADVYLTTQKENFSTKTSFIVGIAKGFGKKFSAKFSVNIAGSTTGQKAVGDVGKGEVILYSGLFEAKTLAAGTVLKTLTGVVFALSSNVTVPAATTSGTLDSGGIVTKPGKITIPLAANAIGPEGNISQSTKLYLEQYKNTDLYAVATKDFSGGYRRKVRIFSEQDAAALEKKALLLAQKEVQDKFEANNTANSIFFNNTLTTNNVEKNFSEKIATEIDSVRLTYAGDASILYVTKNELIQKVQHEKLKDKEFVAGTFALSSLKLDKKENGLFTYSATVNGKVQRFIDQRQLVNSFTGKLVNSAIKIILQEHTIEQARIVTKPLPIPLVPWSANRIHFVFED